MYSLEKEPEREWEPEIQPPANQCPRRFCSSSKVVDELKAEYLRDAKPLWGTAR